MGYRTETLPSRVLDPRLCHLRWLPGAGAQLHCSQDGPTDHTVYNGLSYRCCSPVAGGERRMFSCWEGLAALPGCTWVSSSAGCFRGSTVERSACGFGAGASRARTEGGAVQTCEPRDLQVHCDAGAQVVPVYRGGARGARKLGYAICKTSLRLPDHPAVAQVCPSMPARVLDGGLVAGSPSTCMSRLRQLRRADVVGEWHRGPAQWNYFLHQEETGKHRPDTLRGRCRRSSTEARGAGGQGLDCESSVPRHGSPQIHSEHEERQ
mmetsp:Transcript_72233/g.182099  ORF Transcript_72233/g.182099 Transcript_72233/m.182099 type:complete len:265 (-) Transcript_72233:268-1062(-)